MTIRTNAYLDHNNNRISDANVSERYRGRRLFFFVLIFVEAKDEISQEIMPLEPNPFCEPTQKKTKTWNKLQK